MKIYKLILLLTLQLAFNTLSLSKNYTEGDTLNVFALNGLHLRAGKSTSSAKLNVMNLGDKVIVLNTLNFDNKYSQVIDELDGHWIYVSYKKQKGYVFDGYLSKLKIPNYDIDLEIECSEGIGIINQYIYKHFGINTYAEKYPIDKFVEINSSDVCGHDYFEIEIPEIGFYRYHRYHEGLGSELVFINARRSEVIILAKILLKRCNMIPEKIDIHKVSKSDKRKFSEYKTKQCCKDIYLYEKGDRIGFLINFFT